MKYYYNGNYHSEKQSHHILQKVLYGLLAIAFGVALAVASERAYATPPIHEQSTHIIKSV